MAEGDRGEGQGFLGEALISVVDDRGEVTVFEARKPNRETKGLAWIWIVAYCMGAGELVFFSNEPAARSFSPREHRPTVVFHPRLESRKLEDRRDAATRIEDVAHGREQVVGIFGYISFGHAMCC